MEFKIYDVLKIPLGFPCCPASQRTV